VIELEHVCVRRGGKTLLDGVSLTVRPEVVVLMGPSGAGKSTLLRIVSGLEAPDLGTVRVGGRILDGGGIHMLPEERNVAMVFQDLALWPHLSAYGNVEFGLKARHLKKDERRERVHAVLASVAMADKAHRRPHELSGGERQRVAIARALVLQPSALLLDEPLANLDVVTKEDVMTLFGRLFSERRIPVLYVTHDPREAARLAQSIVVLENGRITEHGTLGELDHAAATPFARALLRALR
jgi:iron(III) transport system ATP-binding protein